MATEPTATEALREGFTAWREAGGPGSFNPCPLHQWRPYKANEEVE